MGGEGGEKEAEREGGGRGGGKGGGKGGGEMPLHNLQNTPAPRPGL